MRVMKLFAKNGKAKLTLRLRKGREALVGFHTLKHSLVTSVLNDSLVYTLAFFLLNLSPKSK